MAQRIDIPETVSVYYRRVGEAHIFTSPDLRGLHVGDSDLRDAFESIVDAVSGLVFLTFGVDTGYAPDITFEKFSRQLIDHESDFQGRPALVIKRESSQHLHS